MHRGFLFRQILHQLHRRKQLAALFNAGVVGPDVHALRLLLHTIFIVSQKIKPPGGGLKAIDRTRANSLQTSRSGKSDTG